MIPYTLKELKIVARTHPMDDYYSELMLWAVERIENLEKEVRDKQSVIDVFMSGAKNDGDY